MSLLLFCSLLLPAACPLWIFLLPALCLFFRPFSGAFLVGGSFFVFPSSRASRDGKEALRRVIGSVAAGFGSVAATPLRCLLPSWLPGCFRPVGKVLPERKKGSGAATITLCRSVAFVPLERSARRKGRYCLFATFSSSPSPSPVPPFREPPWGGKGALLSFFGLCCFAASFPSSSFRTSRASRDGKGALRRICSALANPCLFSVAARCRNGLGNLDPTTLPGSEKGVAAGLAEALRRDSGALQLLPFVVCSPLGCPVTFVPLERFGRDGRGSCGGFAVRLDSVCSRLRVRTQSVAGSLVWTERRLLDCVCRVSAGSVRLCCRRLLSGRKMAFAGVRSTAPAARPYFFECAGRLERFGAGAALCSDASSSCQKAR